MKDNEMPRNFSKALPGVEADGMLSLQFTDWVQCHCLVLACIHCMSPHACPTMPCIPLDKSLSVSGGWWHLNRMLTNQQNT